MRTSRTVALTILMGLLACFTRPAVAAPASAPIFRCGRVASDHPNPDCIAAAKKEHERRKVAEAIATTVAAEKRRVDRANANLLSRFPDEVVHNKARSAELAPLRASIAINAARIVDLQAARKHLEEEMDFYPPGHEPTKLRQDVGSNEAQLTGRRQVVANQETEMARVNTLYDAQLKQLQALWGNRPAEDTQSPSKPHNSKG